jgi:ankyrin repeat protein
LKGWFESDEKTISEICQQGLLDDIKSIYEENGNKLEAPDEIGWTAFHYASRYNQREIIEFLIRSCDVDVDVITNDDVTPLHLAVG